MRDSAHGGVRRGNRRALVGEEGGQARVGRGIFGSSDQLHRNTLDQLLSNRSNSRVVGVALEIRIKSRTKKSTSAIPLLWC